MRLRNTENIEVKSTLAMYTQDTVREEKESSFSRLKKVVRRFVDQKIKDRNFDARRDDKTAPRAAIKKKEKEMDNVAVAKESKEIVLNGSLKNNDEKKSERKKSFSFPRLEQIF